MAAGIRAVRDRIHALMVSTGAQRAIASPPRKELESADASDDTFETVRPSYLLRWTGDTDSKPKDQISGPKSMREATFALALSVFCGRGEGAGSDVQEADATLADLWEDVVMVLEDPANRDYSVSGMVWTGQFVAGAVTVTGSRASMVGNFRVRYDLDLAAL